MTQVAQSDSELKVFDGFVQSTGKLIDPASVSKENPPAPDLRCQYTTGETVAFELVEFLEQDFARTMQFQLKAVGALYRHFNSMPAMERGRFEALYGNADIQVNFQDDCSSARALSAVPAIFQELMLQPSGFEDLIDSFHDPTLSRAILSLSVQRMPSKGPTFDSPTGGFLDDPCVDTIQRKFQKTYQSQYPIELLAYIGQNPMFPEDVWKPKLRDFLKDRGSIAPFRKIWVLDLNTGKIELTWP
jgi:hypothetical protein